MMCYVSLFLGPTCSGIVPVGAPISIGKEVVGTSELGTANGAFEVLAGGVLGAAANFGAAIGIGCFLS